MDQFKLLRQKFGSRNRGQPKEETTSKPQIKLPGGVTVWKQVDTSCKPEIKSTAEEKENTPRVTTATTDERKTAPTKQADIKPQTVPTKKDETKPQTKKTPTVPAKKDEPKPQTKQTPTVPAKKDETKPPAKKIDFKPSITPAKKDEAKPPAKKVDLLAPPKDTIQETEEMTPIDGLQRKSSLSDEKLQELHETFILFDLNRDGMITKEELGAVLYAFGQRPTVAEVQELIRSVDIDMSGTIDFEEFVKIFSTKLSVDPEQELYEVFCIFDKNSDGFISADELYEMLDKLGEHITMEEAQKMITEADLNKDGKVDYKASTTAQGVCKHAVLAEFIGILNAR